jgi:hypothetical protein
VTWLYHLEIDLSTEPSEDEGDDLESWQDILTSHLVKNPMAANSALLVGLLIFSMLFDTHVLVIHSASFGH